MEIRISDNITLLTPDDYQKQELPYFNEWVKALESGEYKQTRAYLHIVTNNSYCCLGVLSKVQGRLSAAGYDGDQTSYLARDNPCYKQLASTGAFPVDVTIQHPSLAIKSLVSCNDNGIPFNEIAEIIKHIWKPTDTQ
jgi:hypothetical protein